MRNRFQSLPFKFNLQRYTALERKDRTLDADDRKYVDNKVGFRVKGLGFNVKGLGFRTLHVEFSYSVKAPGLTQPLSV